MVEAYVVDVDGVNVADGLRGRSAVAEADSDLTYGCQIEVLCGKVVEVEVCVVEVVDLNGA